MAEGAKRLDIQYIAAPTVVAFQSIIAEAK